MKTEHHNVCHWAQTHTHQTAIREYRAEITAHAEAKATKPSSQPELQQDITVLRSTLLNRLLESVTMLNWSSSTFALAVHLFDHYMSNNVIEIHKHGMLGFCCLWIASKFNENKPKVKMSGALLKKAGCSPLDDKLEFFKLEMSILESINWDLSFVSPCSLVDLLLDSNSESFHKKRLGAIFLCESAMFNVSIMCNYTCKEIARSAIALTNVAWKNLRHKHIKNHKYYQLDNMMLKSILDLQPALLNKYFDMDCKDVIITNLVNLAKQFLRDEQNFIQKQQSLAYWQSLQPVEYKTQFGYLASPSNSPSTPPTLRLTHGHVPHHHHHPYILTPITTPTSTDGNHISVCNSSTPFSSTLFSTPAIQQHTSCNRSTSRSSSFTHQVIQSTSGGGGATTTTTEFYSPVIKRKPESYSLPSSYNFTFTRSKAKGFSESDGYLNDVKNVLLSQQLNDNNTSGSMIKRRKI